jgi:hypothetical protein
MYSQTSTSCEQCTKFNKTCSFGEPQASAFRSKKRQREDDEDEAIIRCPKRMDSSTAMEGLAEDEQEKEDNALAEDVRDAYQALGIAHERVILAELAAKRSLNWARGGGAVLLVEKEQEEEDGTLCEAVSEAYEALGKAKGQVMLAELRAGRALSQA